MRMGLQAWIMEETSCCSCCEYCGGSGLNLPREIFWKRVKRLSPSAWEAWAWG